MKYLSLFSGIEAASVAWHPLGWTAVAFAEVEPFPNAVLKHRWPDVPNLGDVTTADFAAFRGRADIVVGGPPCQAFSVAGLRQSLDDDRGNMTLRYVRICDAIDPRYVVYENVPGILSTADNAFGCLLAALVGADAPLVPPRKLGWTDAGVVAGPRRIAAWRILDAQFFGVPQRRRRVFVVASPRGGGDPAAVLFERASLRGDPPPSRKAREEVAGTLGGGPGSCGWADDLDRAGAFIPEKAHALACHMVKGGDPTTDNYIAHSLRADGFDASEDGTGRGTPLVTVGVDLQNCALAKEDLLGTLDTSRPGRGGGAAVLESGETLQQQLGCLPPRGLREVRSQVRRLTPREAERLQGFSDDYSLVPFHGKPASDGPRYKALGNSMAVPVMAWIGRRIQAVSPMPYRESRQAKGEADE